MKKINWPLLAGGFYVGLALPAAATSLINMGLADMVDQSTDVVVGQPVDRHSADTAQGLYTMTTFSVSDAVVGDSASTITVATPGGIRMSGKFKIAETWPGTPVFLKGQEVLIFLNDKGGVGSQVVGFSQGAIPVTETANGKAVRMPDGNGELVSLETAKAQIKRAAKGR